MVVGSPDNFGRTLDLGFSVQGFKTRQRRKVLEQMRPGDNLVYYVSQVQAFGATARIESEGY
jgi:predicted RNA-binding protein with PUA-like domain